MKCPKKGHVAHDDGEPAIGIRRSAATYSWPRGSDHRVRNPGSQTLIQVSVPLGSHQRRRLAGDPRCGSKMSGRRVFRGVSLCSTATLLSVTCCRRSQRHLAANRPTAQSTGMSRSARPPRYYPMTCCRRSLTRGRYGSSPYYTVISSRSSQTGPQRGLQEISVGSNDPTKSALSPP